jgi:hypothetical protein
MTRTWHPVTHRRCGGEMIDVYDAFCRHCGMRLAHDGSGAAEQPDSPSMIIHARLVSIEKLLLKTIIGVGALLLIVGWIALQMHHFGKD